MRTKYPVFNQLVSSQGGTSGLETTDNFYMQLPAGEVQDIANNMLRSSSRKNEQKIENSLLNVSLCGLGCPQVYTPSAASLEDHVIYSRSWTAFLRKRENRVL